MVRARTGQWAFFHAHARDICHRAYASLLHTRILRGIYGVSVMLPRAAAASGRVGENERAANPPLLQHCAFPMREFPPLRVSQRDLRAPEDERKLRARAKLRAGGAEIKVASGILSFRKLDARAGDFSLIIKGFTKRLHRCNACSSREFRWNDVVRSGCTRKPKYIL